MNSRNAFIALSIIGSFFLMSPSCEKEEQTEEQIESSVEDEAPSKKIDPIQFSYSDDYKDLWAVVDSLQNLGRYRSAVEQVQIILNKASEEQNAPQVVKAVIHKMKYNAYLEEDDYILAINELNAISEAQKFPLKQLVHSITAEVYWQYYTANRWKFVDRSRTVNFENEDVRTWDLAKIADHVNEHYVLSLAQPDSLQATDIEDFKSILEYKGSTKKLRPTLYDFLAHRTLDHFVNEESGITRPGDRFQMTDVNGFGDDESFLEVDLSSDDTLSNHLYACRILQDLTRFHKDDSDPAARIDLNLRRLNFLRSSAKTGNNEDLYFNALERLAETYKGHEGYSEIRYEAARYLNGKGNGYANGQQDFRWEKKKAVEICQEAIERFPKSYGAEKCKSLLSNIRSKTLSFKTESAYSPNRKGKMLIEYRNVDTLHFRVVKVSGDYFFKSDKYGDELIADLLSKSVVNEWTEVLENPGDFQQHSTEILIDNKGKGQYVVLTSNNKEFNVEGNAVAYGAYWVSELSYIYRRNEDESIDVFVTDRTSGEPISGVRADVLMRKYNYNTRQYDVIREEKYTSDKNGMFTIASSSKYRYIYIDLKKGDDQLNNANQLYQYRPYRSQKKHVTTHFFTDRSIYRPGQTVHFKGIMLEHDGDEHELLTNKKTTVTFYDVNYQKVSDLELTTNEYGTFSGTFTTPQGVLNGSMRIDNGSGSKWFSVEEYKRPKFEVSFSHVEGEYRLGEKIKVTGNAKAYAGSTVDGAKVQYRVQRSCTFPYWGYYRWAYYPTSPSLEIANGIMTTNESGDFEIEFTAKEDHSIKRSYYPNYTYTVTADVTDINSETRSSSTYVVVGYNCMNLSLGIKAEIDRKEYSRFKLSSTNLNGQKVNAIGTITVHKLIEPEGVYRTALWKKPDLPKIDETEYRQLFPNDTYNDELNVQKFKKGEKVLSQTFNTEEKDSIDFMGMQQWKPGRYVVESTAKDKFGETVRDIKYITITDKSVKTNPTQEIWSCTPLKTNCEPGETATFLISSAATNLRVLYELEHKGEIIDKRVIKLNRSQELIEILIKEEYRGNVTVHFSAVRFARNFNERHTVYVPFSNKELEVEFESFRNKLLPGQKEEWKVKIKGPKGEKVAAEMVATMYDASLDAFASNSFYFNVFNSFYSNKYWMSNCFDSENSTIVQRDWNTYYYSDNKEYSHLNWWGYRRYTNYYNYRYDYDSYGYTEGVMMDEMVMEESEEEIMDFADAPAPMEKATRTISATGRAGGAKDMENAEIDGNSLGGDEQTVAQQAYDKRSEDNNLGAIQARKNFNETAFFYPHLETNEKGEVIIAFTVPESLTRWKFLSMAHTKDLKTGYLQEEIVTQKELMIAPNAPRFLRQGDQITLSAKIANLSEGDMKGEAQLFLFDAITMEPVDAKFMNNDPKVSFEVKKEQNTSVSWSISVPDDAGTVLYRIAAKSGKHTDGEENAIPILSNRMLVTESMPLQSKGIGSKDFVFNKLVQSGSSKSIKHHKLTLEYTSNPAWYAIQAMPYMMEYPYECAEQVFTRYYANSIASTIVNSSPKIKQVFESWKTSSPDAFLSNLEKNQELKSFMLEETPWVLDAQNESERKKRVGLLFDLNKMDNELSRAMRKLQKMQVSNGGWPWFPGMEESRYITQHIVTGMGHLDQLGVKNVRDDRNIWNMVQKGVKYLDERLIEDYEWLKRHDPKYLNEQRIGQIQVQYLYARSYFQDISMNSRLKEAFDYYQDQAKTYWKNFNIYNEGMLALQAKRYEIDELPEMIMTSLKERSITHEELGMYWKGNTSGYYWYQAPIETQALMIEAFDEVMDDQESVEELKVWLLKQKQTTDWKTTKATAEACYALLLSGTELLENDEQVQIAVDGVTIDPTKLGTPVETGTGYFKTSWSGNDIKPEMGNVTVTRKTEGVSWGAMYWQYFEDLDKITTHETPLQLKKKVFLVKNTESGPVITPVDASTQLETGDKVRIRIELHSDRNMEYVHMKDMRASGFEPINVFSRYKWQDGMGYYESTKDAATNFFIEYLPKGTYVFEYDLRVSQVGDFSNGITTIQCMYAPEFTSHSEGIRVKVSEEK